VSRSGDFEPVAWEDSYEWKAIIGSPMCPLSTSEKWVLTILSRYGDKYGDSIFPSQRELAYRADLTPKTVNKALQAAEQDGWIIRRVVDRPNGRGYLSHTYELTVPAFVADYAFGKGRSWNPPYKEKIVKDDAGRLCVVDRAK